MGQDIFVIGLCVAAAAAGIWCWWVDNGSSRSERKKDKEENTQPETNDKKAV